jgi:hypothetical protein
MWTHCMGVALEALAGVSFFRGGPDGVGARCPPAGGCVPLSKPSRKERGASECMGDPRPRRGEPNGAGLPPPLFSEPRPAGDPMRANGERTYATRTRRDVESVHIASGLPPMAGGGTPTQKKGPRFPAAIITLRPGDTPPAARNAPGNLPHETPACERGAILCGALPFSVVEAPPLCVREGTHRESPTPSPAMPYLPASPALRSASTSRRAERVNGLAAS